MKCPSCNFGAGVMAPMYDVGGSKILRALIGKPRVAGYIVQCPACGYRYAVDKAGNHMALPKPKSYGTPAVVPASTETPDDPVLAEARRYREARSKLDAERLAAIEREKLKHDDDLKFGREQP